MSILEKNEPKYMLNSPQRANFGQRKARMNVWVYRALAHGSGSRTALLFAFSFAAFAVGGTVNAAAQTPVSANSSSAVLPVSPVADPFAKYEPLRIKGTYLSFPGPADTMDGQAGGLRSALADNGIGYLFVSLNNFANNTLGNADRATTHPQQYNGQKATSSSSNFLFMTYDLSRYGIPDGQIVAGLVQNDFTWNPAGPNKLGLSTLSYYQTLFDKKVELKFGYLMNSAEFVGNFIAGSLTSSVFGPAGNIPFQGGLSTFSNTTPGVNVKWNITSNLYDKFGVQRSSNPDGLVTEVDNNPTSLNFTTQNSGTLVINELGYRQFATPEASSTWIRGGAAYNTSAYKNSQFVGTRSTDNSFFYLLGDKQIWQPTPVKGAAARGFYLGFTAEYAPPNLNTFSQYYELRAYSIGPIASRPADVVSLVLTDSVFSNYQVDNARLIGNLAHYDSKSASLSYTARLAPGVYAGLGVSYVNHPTAVTFTPKTGSALNFLASLNLFL